MRESRSKLDQALAVLSMRGWFSERSPELRAALTRIARVRDYAAGEPLYLHGDVPDGLYALVSGGLDLAIPRADGLEITAHRADPGYWIGDLALISGQTRLVSVVAATPSRVVHVPNRPLEKLLDTEPRFYKEFYALTYANFSLTLRLLANLTTSPSEARVALRLLMQEESSTGGVSISQAKLSELVALSAPTLQRVMRRLQEDRLIEVGYGHIRILDRQGLLSLCNHAARA